VNPDTIGRYQVLERIGGGAMGTVYRAHDPQIGRTIAIKVLNVNDQDLHARFRQEVRTAGTLTHPNIVAVHDYGEANGLPFIVMEYVEGQTLAEVLRDRVALSLPYKIRLMQQLCAALEYAHARGVVHRDIKPANLMLDRNGDVKVVDFGIAKAGDAELTRTGSVLGTLTYMSPEQIEGGLIDRRSDIFSVGVVLYEVMSSHRAFQGETPSQIIRAILNEQPVALAERCPGLDPAFDRIARKALHKNPSERYQTLAELSADLGRIAVAPAPVVAADDPTGTLLVDRARRRETLAPSAAPVPHEESPPRGRRASWMQWAWIGVAAVAAIVAIGTGVRLAMLAFSTSPEATVATPPAPADNPAVATPVTSEPAPVAPATSDPPRADPKVATITAPHPQPTVIDKPVVRQPKPVTPELTPSARAAAIMAGNPGTAEQAQAADLFRQACEAGEAPACLQAGSMYRDNGLLRNLPVAMQMFERACDAGAPQGCTSLGLEHARGVGVVRDEAKAAVLFKRACDGRGFVGCDHLGRAYQSGRGVVRDDVMARSLFQKACDGGAPAGCLNLGLMLVRGIGGAVDERGGVALFERACDGGNTNGCGNLGGAYARGTGVPRDDAKAVALFQRACDAGGAPACASLAGMYSGGRGVTQDLGRAAVLLQRSCDGRYAEACQQLAQRYERGAGVPRDPARAADLLRVANQLRGTSSETGGTTTGGTTAGGSTGVVGGVVGGVTSPPPPPPRPANAVRIGGNIKPPQKTKHVAPVYPPIAQSSRVQGVVIVEAVIGVDGKVTTARVIRSIPLLDQAAVDAVKQWEFTPTFIKGEAAPVIMTVTVSFTLS
jgi:serine/threonine-protein kinase